MKGLHYATLILKRVAQYIYYINYIVLFIIIITVLCCIYNIYIIEYCCICIIKNPSCRKIPTMG